MLVAVLSGIAIWETLRGFALRERAGEHRSAAAGLHGHRVRHGHLRGGARRRAPARRADASICWCARIAARAEAEAANRRRTNSWRCWATSCEPASRHHQRSAFSTYRGSGRRRVRGRPIRHQITHLGRLSTIPRYRHVTSGDIILACEPLNLATSVQSVGEQPASMGRLERHVVDVRPSRLASADPTRLNQIVANLLTNAIKYTSRAARSAFASAARRTSRSSAVSTPASAFAHLILHMFDLRAGRALGSITRQGGLGVGLTLVRRLVELHGGRVQAFTMGPGARKRVIVRCPSYLAEETDSQSCSG